MGDDTCPCATYDVANLPAPYFCDLNSDEDAGDQFWESYFQAGNETDGVKLAGNYETNENGNRVDGYCQVDTYTEGKFKTVLQANLPNSDAYYACNDWFLDLAAQYDLACHEETPGPPS